VSSAEELLGIVTDPANITDSPDLGPPPVAHFEQGDPIKFDPGQNEPLRQDWIVNAEESNQNLSANLETRKKRRESSHRRNGDVGRSNPDSARISSAKEALGVDQPLKSGAKRKLNVRDDGETPEPIENRDNNGELSNSRGVELTTSERGDAKPITTKASKSINSKASLARPLSTQVGKEKPIDAPASSMSSNRKALGPSKF